MAITIVITLMIVYVFLKSERLRNWYDRNDILIRMFWSIYFCSCSYFFMKHSKILTSLVGFFLIYMWAISSIRLFRKKNKNKNKISILRYSNKMVIKQFAKFTVPTEPFKRDFTPAELRFLHNNFGSFGWSKIDANGLIVLNGGESLYGTYYITANELEEVVKITPNYNSGYVIPGSRPGIRRLSKF